MKSKVKQILSIVMTVCMLSTMIPFSAYGADLDFSDDTTAVEDSVEDDAVVDSEVEVNEDESTDISSEDVDIDADVEEDSENQDEQDANLEETDGEEALFTSEEADEFSDEAGDSDISALYKIEGHEVTTALDSFYKICFVDCGRKYFSVASLKAIIDNASKAGFNYIELAVGNDGLRLLLDDMSIEVNGKTYESDAVKAAIQKGNQTYNSSFATSDYPYYYPYDPEVNELTQAEMDEVVAYAKSKNLEVIPLVNTPGHMDAILSAATALTGTDCAYNGSARTIDVTNATAVAFTEALVQKYITYFAGKGCTTFNMGADEYANDKFQSGSMGFGNLQSTEKYSYYVDYVNKMADMIKGAGMWPMAFNDGIYFNNNTDSGTFDKDIVVCYWSNGWTGYTPMPASSLDDMKYKLINTNGSYYWVLGKKDAQCSAETATGFETTVFPGCTINDPRGAMFCIWSDYPGAETEADVISKTAATITAFGSKLPDSCKIEMDYGKNENESKGELKVGASVTLNLSGGVEITSWQSSKENVVKIEGLPSVADNEISAVSDETADNALYSSVKVTGSKPGKTLITLTGSNGRSYNTEITVPADESNPEEKDITVTVGGTTTDILDGRYESSYTTDDAGIATVATKYQSKPVSVKYSATASASKTAYTDPNTGTTYPASNLIDGNAETFYWSSKEQAVGDYVQVDIGAAISFDTVRLTSTNTDQCENANVMVSADGSNWTPIARYTGSSSSDSFENTLSQARYIKVEIKQSKKNWWQLAEIEWGNTTNGTFTRMPASGTATVGDSDQTVVTFNGVSVGDTSVQIGLVKYIIHVIEEDINTVSPLEIEYWITNADLSYNGSHVYSVDAAKAYSEAGISVADFLPDKLARGKRDVYYWRCQLLDKSLKNDSTSGTEEQTTTNGDDETFSGISYTKVRYFNSSWQVYTEENKWIPVEDKHQLVAYYREYIKVTDEVKSYAADWGIRGDGTSTDWLNDKEVNTISYQVVYEDNTKNPAGTDADSLKSKTICYGYWNGGRGIGTIMLDQTTDYEIYKVSAETGAMSGEKTSEGGYVVNSFNWDGNETIVWDEKKDQKSPEGQVLIHNNAKNPKTDGFYENLMWDENYESILIRVYVRAKVTADSLAVHYIDQTDGNKDNEFYKQNIAVQKGTTFDPNFAWNETKKKLENNTVQNTIGVTQTVQWDLAKMTEIGAQYRYSKYQCVGAKRSGDGKDVYIYYEFENSHSFVVDYGLPLRITSTDLGLETTDWTKSEISNALYGTAELDKVNHAIVYTPTKVMLGAENLTLTLTGSDTEGKETFATHTINIYPATTVYYEEGFAKPTGFSGGTTGSGSQKTAVLGNDDNNYGYDDVYASAGGASNGSAASSTAKGDTASFDFVGTGVDIYANTTDTSGTLTIKIADKTGATQKLAIVNTKMEGKAAETDTGFNVPVFSVTDLAHGEYEVTISHSMNANSVSLDGFRVYNTIKDSTIYLNDDEDNPSFLEVRDLQFGKLVNAKNYGKEGRNIYAVGEQVYKDITTEADAQGVQALLTVNGDELTEAEQKNLYENGPKNEVYLAEGSTLTFRVDTRREVQLGLKGVDGATTCSINEMSRSVSNEMSQPVSSVDMFYTIKNKDESTGATTITIKNTGDKILSVTKLKVCDDPNAIQPLSVDSVVSALYAVGLKDPEPVTPTVTATPTPTQKPAQQIKLDTPKLDKVAAVGHNALKVSWSKVKNADGYRVYVKENGKWKTVGDTKSTSYVHKNLKIGKSYTYTVKAYKKTADGTVWSSYNKKGITGKTVLKAPKLRRVKRNSAKKATLTWNKVDGANGYVVYRKTNNGSWKAVKRITKGNVTSFTDTKLSKGKKYTYTVRAYCTVDKKNVYSGYDKKGLTVK